MRKIQTPSGFVQPDNHINPFNTGTRWGFRQLPDANGVRWDVFKPTFGYMKKMMMIRNIGVKISTASLR
jgi:hypothetical protein